LFGNIHVLRCPKPPRISPTEAKTAADSRLMLARRRNVCVCYILMNLVLLQLAFTPRRAAIAVLKSTNCKRAIVCAFVVGFFVFVYVLRFCLSSMSRRVLVWLPKLVALFFVIASSSLVACVPGVVAFVFFFPCSCCFSPSGFLRPRSNRSGIR